MVHLRPGGGGTYDDLVAQFETRKILWKENSEEKWLEIKLGGK